jgi:hypothetical protein
MLLSAFERFLAEATLPQQIAMVGAEEMATLTSNLAS